jgi:SAM-dependent methyltransferase
MHPSVLDFLRQEINGSEILGKRVLEVGSYNVNGTARDVICPLGPSVYTGVDSHSGPCVDRIVLADELIKVFGEGSFDVVLSTEMLEHVRDWRMAVTQMKGVTKVGGLLVLTTRSPGFPYHPYPEDHWRYTPDHFRAIFSDMEIMALKDDPLPGHPGVFLKARRMEVQLLTIEELGKIQVDKVR